MHKCYTCVNMYVCKYIIALMFYFCGNGFRDWTDS